jgi:UDP-sugar pyrophosphorylase
MMQDYPKLLPNCDKVGFTDIPKGLCFSTVKNDIKTAVDKVNKGLSGESASTCEAEFNFFNRVLLRMCGADIE